MVESVNSQIEGFPAKSISKYKVTAYACLLDGPCVGLLCFSSCPHVSGQDYTKGSPKGCLCLPSSPSGILAFCDIWAFQVIWLPVFGSVCILIVLKENLSAEFKYTRSLLSSLLPLMNSSAGVDCKPTATFRYLFQEMSPVSVMFKLSMVVFLVSVYDRPIRP